MTIKERSGVTVGRHLLPSAGVGMPSRSEATHVIIEAIASVVRGEALPGARMEAAMEAILRGDATPAQIAALAVALRMRGETAEELAAAARVMRRHAAPLALCADRSAARDGQPTAAEAHSAGAEVGCRPERSDPRHRLLDTCGTGGDGARTFNISTVAAIVAAACGVRVAKHGNRAVSSSCGSADVLEALGLPLDLDPAASLDAHGIAFLFAPAFHGALKHAAPVRRELGLRTFFNLLGPLANPAGASHQLLGVYDEARVTQIAEVLGALGVEGAWVVHGAGGLDEVSPSGPTRVAVLHEGRVEERVIEPRDFGLEPVPLEALFGGGPRENATIAREVLAGERGGPRAAVVINAAAALVASGAAGDLREAAERAAAAIDGGAAARLLARWIG